MVGMAEKGSLFPAQNKNMPSQDNSRKYSAEVVLMVLLPEPVTQFNQRMFWSVSDNNQDMISFFISTQVPESM